MHLSHALLVKLRGNGGEVKLWSFTSISRYPPGNTMRCPVGQLCNPAQVPPAFLKSLCCTCTAPVETSVPVQRYLNSPSSGEGHEQSKCFFLQPHSFSGLWVNFCMSKNGGWWGQFISLLRNIIWQ